MPDVVNIKVDSVHPVPVEPGVGGTTVITVLSGSTVFYGQSGQVSSTNSDGSLTVGQTLTITTLTWVVSASRSSVNLSTTVTATGNVTVGSDGTVGGPGGTPLSPSVVSESSGGALMTGGGAFVGGPVATVNLQDPTLPGGPADSTGVTACNATFNAAIQRAISVYSTVGGNGRGVVIEGAAGTYWWNTALGSTLYIPSWVKFRFGGGAAGSGVINVSPDTGYPTALGNSTGLTGYCSLRAALSTAAPITALPVNALPVLIPAGTVITLLQTFIYAPFTQQFTTTADAAIGATSIPVVSATPNAAYQPNSPITGPMTTLTVTGTKNTFPPASPSSPQMATHHQGGMFTYAGVSTSGTGTSVTTTLTGCVLYEGFLSPNGSTVAAGNAITISGGGSRTFGLDDSCSVTGPLTGSAAWATPIQPQGAMDGILLENAGGANVFNISNFRQQIMVISDHETIGGTTYFGGHCWANIAFEAGLTPAVDQGNQQFNNGMKLLGGGAYWCNIYVSGYTQPGAVTWGDQIHCGGAPFFIWKDRSTESNMTAVLPTSGNQMCLIIERLGLGIVGSPDGRANTTGTYTGYTAYNSGSTVTAPPCQRMGGTLSLGSPITSLPVQGAWGANLSAALSTGGAISSLPITTLSPACVNLLKSGTLVTVTDPTGVFTQQFTLTADAAVGVLSLAVSSSTPTYAFPAGSAANGGIPFPLAKGSVVQTKHGANTQNWTLSAQAFVGATALSVVSQTPNFAYALGDAVQQGPIAAFIGGFIGSIQMDPTFNTSGWPGVIPYIVGSINKSSSSSRNLTVIPYDAAFGFGDQYVELDDGLIVTGHTNTILAGDVVVSDGVVTNFDPTVLNHARYTPGLGSSGRLPRGVAVIPETNNNVQIATGPRYGYVPINVVQQSTPPTSLNASAGGTGGTIATGTYLYRAAHLLSGGGKTGASNEVSVAVTSGQNVTLGWTNLPSPPHGQTVVGTIVYRTPVGGSAGTEVQYVNVATVSGVGVTVAGTGVSYIDTGGTALANPTSTVVLANASTVNGTNVVSVGSFSGLVPNMPVSHANLPAGSTVLALTAAPGANPSPPEDQTSVGLTITVQLGTTGTAANASASGGGSLTIGVGALPTNVGCEIYASLGPVRTHESAVAKACSATGPGDPLGVTMGQSFTIDNGTQAALLVSIRGGGPGRLTQEAHTWAVSGAIAVPSGATNYLPLHYEPLATGVAKKLLGVMTFVRGGTSATVSFQQNGSAVSGLGAVVVTTTPTFTPATVPPGVANLDSFAPVVTAISGTPDGMTVTAIFQLSL